MASFLKIAVFQMQLTFCLWRSRNMWTSVHKCYLFFTYNYLSMLITILMNQFRLAVNFFLLSCFHLLWPSNIVASKPFLCVNKSSFHVLMYKRISAICSLFYNCYLQCSSAKKGPSKMINIKDTLHYSAKFMRLPFYQLWLSTLSAKKSINITPFRFGSKVRNLDRRI